MLLNRFKLGALISLIWLLLMLLVVILQWSSAQTMKPNEWGDFFAGFFAPLAFLWLVLGYLQQGDELQLSTKALQLQAEELKNSVEQQRELVEVTRQQLNAERDALTLDIQARKEAAKPMFVFKNEGGSFSENECNFNISIGNAGSTVTQVKGTLEIEGIPTYEFFNYVMFVSGGNATTRLSIPIRFPENPAILTVTYLDSFGQFGRSIYSVSKQDDTLSSMLNFDIANIQ